MRVKTILFASIIMLFTVSACSSQSMRIQDIAPDFALEGLDGEEIILSDLLKTKTVVLDFWATWCRYCIQSVPAMEKFYQENKDKVALIGIDIGESKAKVESFVRKKGILYPIALDSKGRVAKLYKVRGIPTVVAVNQDGKIIYYGHSIKEMLRKVEF